ncbi:hypothetical protein [Blastococcus sp. SYSU DS0541]
MSEFDQGTGVLPGQDRVRRHGGRGSEHVAEASPFPVSTAVQHRERRHGTLMSVESDRLTVLFDQEGYKTLARAAVESHDLLEAAGSAEAACRHGMTGQRTPTWDARGRRHGRRAGGVVRDSGDLRQLPGTALQPASGRVVIQLMPGPVPTGSEAEVGPSVELRLGGSTSGGDGVRLTSRHELREHRADGDDVGRVNHTPRC